MNRNELERSITNGQHENDPQTKFIEVTVDAALNFSKSPEAHEMFSYWNSRSQNGALPLWKDLNWVDVPAVIPNLVVISIKGEPPVFTTIMTGTNVIAEIGQDNTNIHVHELAGADAIIERFAFLLANRTGYFLSDAPVTWASNDYKNHSALMLPATGADGNITHLVGWVGDFC